MFVNDMLMRSMSVFIGGALGAVSRYGLQELAALIWPNRNLSEPLSLFAINLSGCFIIGAITVHHVNKRMHPHRHALLATGVLGGFTSFSTYIVLVDRLAGESHLSIGLGYLALSLVACVLGVGLGQAVGRRDQTFRHAHIAGGTVVTSSHNVDTVNSGALDEERERQ